MEFESAQTALGVLQHSEPVLIHGVRLTVKPRTVKEVQLTPNLTHKGEHERRDTKRVKTDLKLATRKSSFSLHKKILEVMTTAKSVRLVMSRIKCLCDYYKENCLQLLDCCSSLFVTCMCILYVL